MSGRRRSDNTHENPGCPVPHPSLRVAVATVTASQCLEPEGAPTGPGRMCWWALPDGSTGSAQVTCCTLVGHSETRDPGHLPFWAVKAHQAVPG